MSQLRFVVYSDRPSFAARVAEELRATGHVEVLDTVADLDRLRDAARTRRPDAIFADLGLDAEGVLEALARIPAPRPALLVAAADQSPDLILRAMRLGAKEYFGSEPTGIELSAAVERIILEHPAAAQPQPKLAPVVAVMGAKGGVGATFVACQLAAALERAGGRAAIVDLNLRLGDVALYLDLQPRYTLADAASEADRLDATSLRAILQKHRCGLDVLAAPSDLAEAESIGARQVDRVLRLLREEYDWVMVDVSRSWDEAGLHALDLADQILLVTLLDVPALTHARKHLHVLHRLGHTESKVRLVANRWERGGAVSDRDYASFLGRAPDARIPNDYRTTAQSVNQGRLVSEVSGKGALDHAFAELATSVRSWCGVDAAEAAPAAGIARRVLNAFTKGGRHGAD